MKLAAPALESRSLARLRRVGVVVGLLLACVVHAPQAEAAQDPAKANALFKQAKSELEAGEPHKALRLVTSAAEYFSHPAIFLLKAKILATLGRHQKALAVFESISTRKLSSAFRKVRAQGIKSAKDALAKSGHLLVELRPAQAVATVDGKRFSGGIDTWLPAGVYKIVVKADGYSTKRETVTLAAGGKAELAIGLQKLVGLVRVTVVGGLKGVGLKVDGKVYSVDEGKRAGDMVTIKLPVGAHDVACSRGALLESHTVNVVLGRTVAVACSQIGGGPSRVAILGIGWGGVAAGVALAGYGAWGLQSYFADMERAEQQGLIADTNKHYGGALYLASGLAIGVTSYLLLVREPAASPAATALAPTAASPWRADAP